MAKDDNNQALESDQPLPPHQAAVKRNPWLQERWFTRLMAPVIVGGATMKEPDYKRAKLFFWGVAFLVSVFGTNTLLGAYSLSEAVFVITFLTILVACVPVMVAARLGYREKNRIDSNGVPRMAIAKSTRITLVLIIAAPWATSWLAGLFD